MATTYATRSALPSGMSAPRYTRRTLTAGGDKPKAPSMFSGLASTLEADLAARRNAAMAEVDADAAAYEAEQNRAAGQQAFQFALSQANTRRPVGGGVSRGGNRIATLGGATGGLAAANAAARRQTMTNLAKSRFEADPANRAAMDLIKTGKTIGTGKPLDYTSYLRFRDYWNTQQAQAQETPGRRRTPAMYI